MSELHSGPKTALHSNGNDSGSLVQVRTLSCSSGRFSSVECSSVQYSARQNNDTYMSTDVFGKEEERNKLKQMVTLNLEITV